MKIKSIKIRNFKCHKEVDLTFDEKFTALIGENDIGKSSILDFLEVMLTNKKSSDYKDFYYKEFDDIHNKLNEIEDFEGEIIFDLNNMSTDELIPYKEYIDNINNKELKIKRNSTQLKDYYSIWKKCFNKEFLNDFKNEGVTALREFIKNNDETKEIAGIAKLKQDECINIIENFIEGKEIAENNYKWAYVETNFNNIKNLLPDFIKYDSENYDEPINLVKDALELVFKNELYELDANKKSFIRDEITNKPKIRNQKLVEVYEASIKVLKEKAEEFKNFVESIINHIEISINPEIDFSKGFKPGEMIIKNKRTGIETNYENNGAGTKQRLYMAIFEWQQEIEKNLGRNYTIKCFDEPDNNLHISAQRKLLKTLKDTTNKVQTIITTHSLFMVDTVKADSIRLLKRNENFETQVEKLEVGDDEELKQFIHEMCREMGLSNSHIFFEKCFILVEGDTEQKMFPKLYQTFYNSTMAEDGITLINQEGNDRGFKYTQLLIENKFDITMSVYDFDQKENKKQEIIDKRRNFPKLNEYWNSGNVLFIGNDKNKEIEALFSNESICKALKNELLKRKKPELTPSELIELRCKEKFSEALKDKTTIKKPDIGEFIGETCSKEDIPIDIINVFEKARTIAGV